jgi:ABC-type glutathione transport system ATPase component
VAGITPYKGLLYFDEADSELFFGREALTARLVSHVMDLSKDASTRFLAVVGASGSGKSSLVRAGLAVGLRRAGWEVLAFTPAHPIKLGRCRSAGKTLGDPIWSTDRKAFTLL